MPAYESPYDVDTDIVIKSIRKVAECFDICGHFRILGGEPFLNQHLKEIIAEVPSEKCLKVSIPTNASIVPDDLELYARLREKRVTVVMGGYPSSAESQRKLISVLDQEGVMYELPHSDTWINYGEAVSRERSRKEHVRQFARCRLRAKSVLNGVMYYCPRHAHGFDLGIIPRNAGEYVDLLNNTASQNRREVRRLMWRHAPIEACKYCLRGIEKEEEIPRGV